MSELRDLYQEIILDHYRTPRNCQVLPGASHSAEGYNPLCGDRVKIFLQVQDGIVREVTFAGAGCAISTASASLLTELVKGKTVAEARALFERFHTAMTAKEDAAFPAELDKLAALQGVREFPMRVKCATLAWHALAAALDASPQPISTE